MSKSATLGISSAVLVLLGIGVLSLRAFPPLQSVYLCLSILIAAMTLAIASEWVEERRYPAPLFCLSVVLIGCGYWLLYHWVSNTGRF